MVRFLASLSFWVIALFGAFRLPWLQANLLVPFAAFQQRIAVALFGVSSRAVIVDISCTGSDAMAICFGARDIQTDEDGRIWILAATADPNWRDSRFVRGKDPITAEQLDEHYDSIVQVLDPAGATILASERFPTHFWAFAGAGFVFRIASDEAGEVRAEVWRVELVVQ